MIRNRAVVNEDTSGSVVELQNEIKLLKEKLLHQESARTAAKLTRFFFL
jgi:hypothetical protein